MLLSRSAVQASLDCGSVGIHPFDPIHFKEASYTFHLGDRLRAYASEQVIDLERLEPAFTEFDLPSEGYVLAPGAFIVGYLRERLTLGSDVAALLTVRGSCAQAGLNALNSDLFIEPNSDLHLKLAMKNISSNPIRLRAGMKIVKGVFFSVKR